MKYSVDIENGIAKEALLFNGRKYVRTTEKRITVYVLRIPILSTRWRAKDIRCA